MRGLSWPLADEPHLEAWTDYAREAQEKGALPALRERLVQLRFPVEEGISQTDTYRAATRRGVLPWAAGPGLELADPDGLRLRLEPTLSGRIPILTVALRQDFEALVRALSGRNEPIPVPPSMGACIVTGLNNWDRVGRLRRAFEAARGGEPDDAAWAEEFARLVPQRELYQDRFIILSSGPYSAVPAADLGLADDAWRRRSLEIRTAHECTHYLTHRAYGRMRNNLLDELIADFAGLLQVDGAYDASLALRFLGLEDYPRWREGGRLSSYLGDPPLPPSSTAVLHTLVHRAVRNLAACCAARAPRAGDAQRWALALAGLTLEELAAEDMPARLAASLDAVPAAH